MKKSRKTFDQQFGAKFFTELPTDPGIYRFYCEAGELIYVGKAKNLKRRLSQYRNAKRRRAHAKMRKIVAEARALTFETCVSEAAALLLENQWIQEHRPKWNVAGAFSFLYPMVGIQITQEALYLCYTTQPDDYPSFQFHGAFRSRERTRTAFFSLVELLYSIGHSIPKATLLKKLTLSAPPKFTYFYGFRQTPSEWMQSLSEFLNGNDFSPIPDLALLLLEKPDALKRASEVEDHLKNLKRFWRHEILPLKKVRTHCQHLSYPIQQKERDQLFITFQMRAQI